MELLLLLAALFVVLIIWSTTVTVAFAIGLAYGRRYYDYDGSERRGEHFWPRLRQCAPWRGLRWCCRFAVSAEVAPLPLPTAPCLVSFRPHGILALTATLAVLAAAPDEPFARTRLAVHRILLSVPLLRDLLLALGCLEASEAAIAAALRRGDSVAILPGGVHEMASPPVRPPNACPGIVRLAHAHGVPLIVVHCAGETDLCWVPEHSHPIMRRLRELTYTWLRYPFPTFALPRLWRRPRLHALIRRVLQPTDYATKEDMAAAFLRASDA